MNQWKNIQTDEDINNFLTSVCHFHDAGYSTFEYLPVVNDSYGAFLFMNFNVFTLDENNELVKTGIEMEFYLVDSFNFRQALRDLISVATIKQIKDGFVWGIVPGPSCPLNEYGFSDCLTWVKCKSIKWRFCPVHENE